MNSPPKNSDKPLTPRHAWQPVTPRGIAAFADATLTRLIVVQLIVGAIVAVAVIWFLRIAWFPVITEAVQHLPEAGVIQEGVLLFGAPSPQSLAENARLAMVVDMDQTRPADHVADVAATFKRNGLEICGALGCWWLPYERGHVMGFNRPEVEPAWGAWRGPILALVGLGVLLLLFLLWWSIAFIYLPLVKLIAFFNDRVVTWRGAWKLSAAALLPGALLVALAVVLYGFGAIDLFRFTLLYVLHVLSGLLFVSTGPLFLPKVTSRVRRGNPFSGSDSTGGDKPSIHTKPGPFSQRKPR